MSEKGLNWGSEMQNWVEKNDGRQRLSEETSFKLNFQSFANFYSFWGNEKTLIHNGAQRVCVRVHLIVGKCVRVCVREGERERMGEKMAKWIFPKLEKVTLVWINE